MRILPITFCGAKSPNKHTIETIAQKAIREMKAQGRVSQIPAKDASEYERQIAEYAKEIIQSSRKKQLNSEYILRQQYID